MLTPLIRFVSQQSRTCKSLCCTETVGICARQTTLRRCRGTTTSGRQYC